MTSPIDLGSRRELFVDSLLIDRLRKASLHLHEPQPRELVLQHDTPWEGPFSLYHTIIHDGDKYLLYYRGWKIPEEPAVYCVAVSDDGVHFERPQIAKHAWHGDKQNNIIFAQEPFTHTMAPFLDTREGVSGAQRYKALSRYLTDKDHEGKRDAFLHGLVSADGIDWELLGTEPLITDGKFDSQNVGFWSEAEDQYVAYYRTFSSHEGMQEEYRGPTTTATSLRRIKRATSKDFVHWEPGVIMDYRQDGKQAPAEEFYINQTRPYFRAPHIYVALPARFMDQRSAVSPAAVEQMDVHPTQLTACSDACFMTARPGNAWYDRTFMEGFIKPRIGADHWTARCNYPVDGVVQTGPDEMSLYVCEHYAQPGNQVRRYSLRLDGFSSVRAPHSGGELITKPVVFTGVELELNYATSAAGSLRVEIRDESGKPIPGYTLREAVDIFGNRIDGRAAWKHGTDVSGLAGRPVRLRFVMGDADLYSMRFAAAV
ncbi:MAG: hypothetical protein HN712_13580 [Gemmatimonadetes bacterium]|jgi:hypothetical protein|nr:hypothetical protein [Gemmatimonadota bacterium]MBT6145180.1 hypothetical protein [Gemmatimonadota bacterium]MBT7861347.1 hypothetical protein [Gemmatimonadota bacterium]